VPRAVHDAEASFADDLLDAVLVPQRGPHDVKRIDEGHAATSNHLNTLAATTGSATVVRKKRSNDETETPIVGLLARLAPSRKPSVPADVM
jgi:hypothetical protein